MTKADHDLRAIGAQFELPGAFVEARRHGTGHINDTYAATYAQGGCHVRYIHQRINTHVFRRPEQLMANVSRVLAHAGGQLADAPDADRRTLTLVPARDGAHWVHDEAGEVWRTYLFIERAHTIDVLETPAQAETAAAAFGRFQRQLADLPGTRLFDTIPDFHHTRRRFDALVASIDADVAGRAHLAREPIGVAMAHEADVDRLLNAAAAGELPERVTHNDTKINNVMLDDASGAALCVVDLDTTMPGLAAYDFGDMVRTATNAAAEDEPDVTRVASRPAFFEALVRGYLAEAGAFLCAAEVDVLAFSGQLLALEQGIRFLTDYLQGDTYYRIHRPSQNLERARAQFALMASIERQQDAYAAIVRRYS
ncbi:MAG TPA: aminoglycoside phosphotransferase family protein [Luteitalea sp.]|nr:aminoglycoside phosphotransferase family protein [Luteitalea sp.]